MTTREMLSNVESGLRCQCIHQGYPNQYNCFDVRYAQLQNPSNITPEFLKRIRRGETLCVRCATVEALLKLSLESSRDILMQLKWKDKAGARWDRK